MTSKVDTAVERPPIAAAALAPAPVPNVKDALAFFAALFSHQGCIHFRSVPEPKDERRPVNHHYMLDQGFKAVLGDFLAYCNVEQRAAFFLPGFVRPGGTGKADVLSLPTILVDFDKGNPAANLAAAEGLIGPATVVVESGGETASGPKLHAYWRLATPASGSAIEQACRVREELAHRFGGDPAFKQAAQVIRIPGSVHFKGKPKLVKLRRVGAETYDLAAVVAKLGLHAPTAADPFFDFNNVVPLHASAVDRVMTAPIRAEAQDELTRFDGAGVAIGHFLRQIREGRMTLDQAWEAAKAWNAATMQPPWPEDRLRIDFDRLASIDAAANGPFKVPAIPANEWARFDKWTADAFRGAPQPRPWLIDGVLALGIPGMIAARGGVGKSYLIADLALRVAIDAPVANTHDYNDRQIIFGGEVMAHGTVVVFAAEDDHLTIHERLIELDPDEKRFAAPDRLRIIPLPSAGGARALFRTTARDHFEETAEFEAIRAWLRTLPDLKLIVFDPLQAFVAADITAKPEAGQFVCTTLGALAAETKATVLVTHHVGKTKTAIGSAEELRDAIRGTTALVDGLRWVYGLWDMSAGSKGGDDVVAAGGVAKANLKTCRREHEYRRLPSGVLRQIPPTIAPNDFSERLDALEKAIIGAAAAGAPFTHTSKSSGLFAEQHRLPEPFKNMSKAPLEKLGKQLLNAGRIVKGTARGSRTREWLDGPMGDFAMGHGEILSGAGLTA